MKTKKYVTKWLTFIAFPLMGMALLILAGCESGTTSSTACQSAFDANGNPTTNCVGDT